MKEIKQKPAGGKPKTADAARVPKAVVKAAWLQAREAARAGEKQVVGGKDGAYSGAADTGEKGADKLVSTGERVTELAYRGGRKLAERSAGQRRERAKAAQTGGEAAQRHGAGETIAHTSTIEASRPPQTREAGRVSDENRPAGARPQQRESRAVAVSFRMVCRNFILPEFCKPCLFLFSSQFAKLIVHYLQTVADLCTDRRLFGAPLSGFSDPWGHARCQWANCFVDGKPVADSNLRQPSD